MFRRLLDAASERADAGGRQQRAWLKSEEAIEQLRIARRIQPPLRFHMPVGPPQSPKAWD